MSLTYYVGQDVGVSASVVDDSGNPASGTVVLTVTDPAGVVTTPAVTGSGGAYSSVVPSVQVPGTWLLRWVATGPAASFHWAYEDQFFVRTSNVAQLVDLASVKAYLNIPTTDTRQDDELQSFILTVGDIARDVCGPLLSETHTQFFSGGTSTISVDWKPLLSVTSATEYYGLSAFTLTEQPLGSQMNAFAFTVDYNTGTLTRRTFGGEAAMFARGAKNVKIVYVAGRAGTIPATVRLGALEFIRHMWQMTQQGGRPKFSGSGYDSEASVPSGFAIPSRVLELWSPFRRPPGIA